MLHFLLSLGNHPMEFPLDGKSYKSRKIRGCFVYDNYRHSYFILNKSLRSQMASSYNLRTRTKEHSPASKKASVQIHQQLAKQSPKTAHKPTCQKPTPTISPSKVISMSSSATITTNQLFPLTHHHNNEISNGELNSNSQLDSLINNSMEKKNKMDQVQHSKQEDAIESILLEEGGFLGRLNGLKGLKRHHSAMEMETEKKQYRSVKHPVVLGVPYRKFQTQLEQKVVGLINKIKQQKNCAKEIEKLFNKIQNAPQKDLKNRYFISGVAVILKLMRQCQQNYYSTQFQQQSQNLFGNLKRRIQVEFLDNISDFQEEQKPVSSFSLSKEKMINRIFKILLKKCKFAEKMGEQRFNREEIQNKSISFVNQFDMLNQTSTKILFERIGAF